MAEECRSCHAPIIWAEKFPAEVNPKTRLPKTMPVNADSFDDPKGNLEVWCAGVIATKAAGAAYFYRFRYLKKGEVPTEGHHRGISHYATCPDAGKWRHG